MYLLSVGEGSGILLVNLRLKSIQNKLNSFLLLKMLVLFTVILFGRQNDFSPALRIKIFI